MDQKRRRRPSGTPSTWMRHVLVVGLGLAAGSASCSLDDPATPFTGTSSVATSTNGTVTNGGTGSPTPPAPPPANPPSSPAPTGGSGQDLVFDALTNGMSVGEISGGQFSRSGWQVTQRGNYIRYRMPTITSGYVEWENLNLTRTNPARDLFSIMGMWDPTKGDYRENPFRVHIRKLDTQGHNPPYVRMRFISGGDQNDVGWDFLDWDPNQVYKWRLEWGPSGSGNEARVWLDGRVIIRTGYGPTYRPEEHWIELGIEERAETIVGLVFRNVRIGRR